MACELSDLARGIHNDLPYVSDIGNPSTATASNGDVIELAITDVDSYVRSGFWGAIIVLIAFILLFLSCVWCCVSCCVCCGQRERKPTSKALPWCLGITELVLTLLAIGVIAAAFWAEQEVTNGVNEFGSVIFGISTNASGTDPSENFYNLFEFYRHWVVVAFLAALLLVTFVTLLIVVLAPLCKSAVPIIVMVGVTGVATVLVGLLAGGTLTSLVFLSDLCADSYAIAQDDLCTSTNSDVVSLRTTLDFFCNDLLMNVFVVMILGCALIVLFILLQAFGSAYAGSLMNYLKSPVEKYREPPPPANTGVWDAYGSGAHVQTQAQSSVPLSPVGQQQPQHQLYPQYSSSLLPPATGEYPPTTGAGEYPPTTGAGEYPPTASSGECPPKYADMYPEQQM